MPPATKRLATRKRMGVPRLHSAAPLFRRAAVIAPPDPNACDPGHSAYGKVKTPLHTTARYCHRPSSLLHRPHGVHDGEEIERGITEFAHRPNGGLIVVGPTSSMTRYRDLVVDLAARYRLPAVYSGSAYRSTNALMSYGADAIEQYRRAASYVDRILKGERPADLPVQAPTKFKLVINLKTAKSLGLTIPPALITAADEVIE